MARRKQTAPEPQPPQDLEVRARGKEAKRMMRAASRNGDEQSENGKEDKLDQIIELLDDAKNVVVVRRISPKFFRDIPVAVELYREQCPLRLEDIKQDVFQVHGGHKFQLRINDCDGRPLSAIVFENKDVTEPYIREVEDDSADPDKMFEEREQEPLEKIRDSMNKQVDLLQKRNEIENLRDTIEDLKAERGGAKPKGDDPRVVMLERKVQDLGALLAQKERDKEMDGLRREISDLKTILTARPAADREKEELRRELSELRREISGRRDERGEKSLLQTMIDNQGRMLNTLMQKETKPPVVETDEDKILAKLAKYKDLFSDKGKSAQFEEMLLEAGMDALRGKTAGGDADGDGEGNPEDEDDMVKYAMKEMLPVLKDHLRDKLKDEKKQGRTYTKEEVDRILAQQVKRAATEVVAKMRQEKGGTAMQPSQPGPQPQQPLPPPRPPQGAARSPLDGASPPQSKVPVPEKPSAPAPQQEVKFEKYDRKDAVNYTLRVLWRELNEGCPEDSEALAAALDTWDDQLKDEIENAETSDDVEGAIKPHADEKLWGQIIERTEQDDKAKKWLRRLITTLQQEWGSQKAEQGGGQPEKF